MTQVIREYDAIYIPDESRGSIIVETLYKGSLFARGRATDLESARERAKSWILDHRARQTASRIQPLIDSAIGKNR